MLMTKYRLQAENIRLINLVDKVIDADLACQCFVPTEKKAMSKCSQEVSHYSDSVFTPLNTPFIYRVEPKFSKATHAFSSLRLLLAAKLYRLNKLF